jgi:hypothetical protein
LFCNTRNVLEELAVVVSGAGDPPSGADGSLELTREFPTISIRFDADGPNGSRPDLTRAEWDAERFDSWAFDCRVDDLAAGPFTLRIADESGASARDTGYPLQVLNRCQRHIGRRNRHSRGDLFTRVLRRHRDLHDLSKPLVRADYNHALDVRHWLLRLDPDASAALQLAALFHDVERLVSEADARVEHLAADYQLFKDAHARQGAEITRRVLAAAGVGEALVDEVAGLVARHERKSDEPELAALNDADALSYFSLNSPGYADYFGPEQTRKKVAWTWNRMSDRARAKLACVKLRADVAQMVREVAP